MRIETTSEIPPLPTCAEDVNDLLVGLMHEDDVDALRSKLFHIIIYIRRAERDLQATSTTEGDTIVIDIENNIAGLLASCSKPKLVAIYPQLRELAAVAPKLRVFGINIHDVREDVGCYDENRADDDPFAMVAQAIREAAHRRLSAEVIKLINELVAFLESDEDFTFISARYCKATREQKDAEIASPLFARLLHTREQLRLIWNDPFSAKAAAGGGARQQETAHFLERSVALVRRMIAPFEELFTRFDAVDFPERLGATLAAMERRDFARMNMGATRYALSRLNLALADTDDPSKGETLLNLMALDCVLENLSLVYYSNLVHTDLFKITDENYELAMSILPDLVLCTRAVGQGTKQMGRRALFLKQRLASERGVSRVEAQTYFKEMSEELMGFIYRLSQFFHEILETELDAPPEELERARIRLVNDIIREKTTHLCGSLISSLGKYLGGEGSPATRQLASIGASIPEDGGAAEISDLVYRFGPDIAHTKRGAEDIWFMGRKGASETRVSQIVREKKIAGVDVPKGFGLCTQAWSVVGDSPENLNRLRLILVREVGRLEERVGKRLGASTAPLLLVARSGAIISLPGMLPTIGHIGLNERIVDKWSRTLAEPARAYHAYLRFIFNYAEVVFAGSGVTSRNLYDGFPTNRVAELCVDDVKEMREIIASAKQNIETLSGGLRVPDEPYEQLFNSVVNVFSAYRYEQLVAGHVELKSLPRRFQTACLVQHCLPMLDDTDSSGIYLTRNPLDGGRGQIEYIHDFGEDLAGGRASPDSNEAFQLSYPIQYAALREIGDLAEQESKSPMDIEFAIRGETLHILQTRPLTLAPMADVVTAHKMYKDGVMSETELVQRTRRIVGQPLINTFVAEIDKQNNEPVASGQPIAGGVVAGRVVFDPDHIGDYPGDKIVFVTKSNVPERASRQTGIDGYISEEGGVTSHAALVSIGKLPCVVGVVWRKYGRGIRFGESIDFREGDWITLDANDGYIYKGKLPVLASPEGHPEYLEAEEEILEIVKTLEEFTIIPHTLIG